MLKRNPSRDRKIMLNDDVGKILDEALNPIVVSTTSRLSKPLVKVVGALPCREDERDIVFLRHHSSPSV
jgi:hypothetical protein